MRSKNAFLLIILLGILFAFSCNKHSMDKVKIVHTRGITGIFNITRSGFWSRSLTDSTSAIALEDGDVLHCKFIQAVDSSQGIIIFQYSGQSEEGLAVKADPENPFKIGINNGDFAIILEDSSAWQWIGKSGKEELEQLQSVVLELPVTNQQMDILTVLAKVKPNLNLVIFNDTTNFQLDSVLSVFKPEWMYLSSDQPIETQQFLKLTNIKSLILENFAGNSKSFKGLEQLTQISISNTELKSLSEVSFPEQIKSLYFGNCSITDIQALSSYKNIEALGFSGCDGLLDISTIKGMKKLRWLACPPNIDQAQFDSLIPTLQSLQVLELIGCDSLTNLEVLKEVPELKSLTLYCKKIDPLEIPPLDDLQLLVIRSVNDSVTINRVQEMQKRLPNTTVVPGGGFCLGSGWLLLLIPMVVLLIVAFRRMKRTANG